MSGPQLLLPQPMNKKTGGGGRRGQLQAVAMKKAPGLQAKYHLILGSANVTTMRFSAAQIAAQKSNSGSSLNRAATRSASQTVHTRIARWPDNSGILLRVFEEKSETKLFCPSQTVSRSVNVFLSEHLRSKDLLQ